MTQLAHQHGCRCHVARVNTKRRLAVCVQADVDSVDGSSASRFPETAALLRSWRDELATQQRMW